MSQQVKNTDLMKCYLLGKLSEDEQEQIERYLMADDDYYHQILIVEDELIDEFVSGKLSEQDRTRFSHRFLSIPERQQDVRFAKAFRKYVSEYAPRAVKAGGEEKPGLLWQVAAFFRRPAAVLSLAGALILALAAVAWLAVQNRRLRSQTEQLQTQQTTRPLPQQDLQEQLDRERQRSEQLASELRNEQEQRADAERRLEEIEQSRQPQSPARSSRPTFVTFFLTPSLTRGSGETNKISVPQGARQVVLQLDLAANDYPSYRATLKTAEGQELLSKAGRRAQAGGKVISFTIPAILLSPGDYQIQLSGQTAAGNYEDVGRYSFRVTR